MTTPKKRLSKSLITGLKGFPPYLLRCAADIVTSRTEEFIKLTLNNNLDSTNLVILFACKEGNLSQSEVAYIAQINPNSMVKRVDYLEKDKYIKRIKNDKNRREYVLTLTPKSHALIDKANKLLETAYTNILHPLGVEDIRALGKVCEQIVQQDD